MYRHYSLSFVSTYPHTTHTHRSCEVKVKGRLSQFQPIGIGVHVCVYVYMRRRHQKYYSFDENIMEPFAVTPSLLSPLKRVTKMTYHSRHFNQ